jgi:hypothetical protein
MEGKLAPMHKLTFEPPMLADDQPLQAQTSVKMAWVRVEIARKWPAHLLLPDLLSCRQINRENPAIS